MSLLQTINFYLDLKKYLLRFYFLDEEKLRFFQNKQFTMAIKYACTRIPFYENKILKNKVDLTKIIGLDQIREFPITEPEDFFSQPHNIRTNKKQTHITFRSSGTTGCPKNIYLSDFDWAYLRRLAYLRMFFTSGCSIFYKTLFFGSSQFCLNIKPRWFQRLGLMRANAISIDKSGLEHAKLFNEYKPDVLDCLTSDGVVLADFMKHQVKRAHRARYLFTSGEILTEKDRRIMIDNLGDKIIDFYANTEIGMVAWQCGKTGAYHINADQIYVEIIDGDRICQNGEAGEIVITTLAPYSSPLIRYKTGDMGVVEHGRCKCGSWFPRLSYISGRKNDFIINTNGEKISPYVLMRIMDNFKEVIKYKICQVQSAEYAIYIKLGKNIDSVAVIKDNIIKAYRDIFGIKSRILITDLSNLPDDAKMKRQTIASYVKQAQI